MRWGSLVQLGLVVSQLTLPVLPLVQLQLHLDVQPQLVQLLSKLSVFAEDPNTNHPQQSFKHKPQFKFRDVERLCSQLDDQSSSKPCPHSLGQPDQPQPRGLPGREGGDDGDGQEP